MRDRIKALRDRFAQQAKTAPERLAPPLDAVLLDEIAGRLDEVHAALTSELPELRKSMDGVKSRLDEQVPKGLMDQEDITVTDAMNSYTPPEALFSADIKNDGDYSIWYVINDVTRDFVELKKKEARVVSMGRPLINKIWFKCAANETSTVRVTGTF